MGETRHSGRGQKVTLLLSAGAPHTPLMAGALAYIHEHGKTFDHIWASGGGALVGLLYAAPKNKSPQDALHDILELSVADPINAFFSVNFKVFKKTSPFLRAADRWSELWKLPGSTIRPRNAYRRLYNDWIDLITTAAMPTDLTPFSQGLCAPLPFIQKYIDFPRLAAWPGEFFLSAYNITNHRMEVFKKEVIDVKHARAAVAFPFFYAPIEIDGNEYTEGALHDPLNLAGLSHYADDLDSKILVLANILGREKLIRSPRNLMEAYGQSIMTPAVSLSQAHMRIFELEEEQKSEENRFQRYQLRFEGITEELQANVLNWSYSSMKQLWHLGLEAGERFLDDHGDILPDIVS